MQDPVDVARQDCRLILRKQENVVSRLKQPKILGMVRECPRRSLGDRPPSLYDPASVEFLRGSAVHDGWPLSQLPHPVGEFGGSESVATIGHILRWPVGDGMVFRQVLSRDLLQLLEQLLLSGQRLGPVCTMQATGQRRLTQSNAAVAHTAAFRERRPVIGSAGQLGKR